MGAEKSKYQSKPWEPDVDKGSGAEQKAADDYTKIYGGSPNYQKPDDQKPESQDDDATTEKLKTVPAVSLAYPTSPDLIPIAQDKPDSGDGPKPAHYPSLTINLGELRATEQTFLDSISTIASHYEALHTKVTAAIGDPNLFGQQTGEWQTLTYSGGSTYSINEQHWVIDENAEGGAETAAATNLRMTELLQGIAGLTETLGVFTADLNNTGQLYTITDANQFLQ